MTGAAPVQLEWVGYRSTGKGRTSLRHFRKRKRANYPGQKALVGMVPGKETTVTVGIVKPLRTGIKKPES